MPSRSAREDIAPRLDGAEATGPRGQATRRRAAPPQRWRQGAAAVFAKLARRVLRDGLHGRRACLPFPDEIAAPRVGHFRWRDAPALPRGGADEVLGAVRAGAQEHGRGRPAVPATAHGAGGHRRHVARAAGHAAHVEVAGGVARPQRRSQAPATALQLLLLHPCTLCVDLASVRSSRAPRDGERETSPNAMMWRGLARRGLCSSRIL
jgi:hypothetical protein